MKDQLLLQILQRNSSHPELVKKKSRTIVSNKWITNSSEGQLFGKKF